MLKHREAEFCRLTAVLGDPLKAAERAGYKYPDKAWPELLTRSDIADEIHKTAQEVSRVFRDTLMCGVYRLMTADNCDAVKLLYRGDISDKEIDEMNLSGVAEMKRTDKGVELKFFDRLKALDKLGELGDTVAESRSAGGLLEAMRLSAEALSKMSEREDGPDVL